MTQLSLLLERPSVVLEPLHESGALSRAIVHGDCLRSQRLSRSDECE